MSNVRQTRSSGSLKNDSLGTGLSSDQNNSVSADSDDEYSLNDQNEEESSFEEDEASKANDSKDKSGSSRSKKGSSKPKLQFTCSNILKEGHNQPIFGIQFNDFYGDDHPPIFATVGSNQVLIYECSRESADIKLLAAYLDVDADESFFTCAWSVDESSCQPLLAAAGARGVIRIISPCTHDPVKNYIGHGQSINELRFSPNDSNLLLSVSKDHTLRLWNIKTDVCVAIFGGVEGHRDELLSGDINANGTLLVSCGMDHSLKIWKLDSECIKTAIEESYKHKKNASGKPFKTYGQHFADFSTRDIHSNYVDCVRWFGRLLLSKSCDNRIVCWKPGRLNSLDPSFIKAGDGHVTSVLHKFEFSACEIWFMRFSLDKRKKLMAVGNQVGKVFVWDLDMGDPREGRHIVLSHPKCAAPVRQIGINNSGEILIAVCDDATIWRWDRN